MISKINGELIADLTARQKAIEVENKLPTKVSQLLNDSGFLTSHQDISGKLNASLKGVANGLAELDASGKVPSTQLPSYVDDVLEYDTLNSFPTTGESSKIYIALDTNITYRWSGSAYVALTGGSGSIVLGETSATAYRGDRGKIAYDHSQTPHIKNVKVNGTALTPSNETVDIAIPTKTSDLTNDDNVVKDSSYNHTDNNYTSAEKTKLSGIENGSQANKIEGIKVNGILASIVDKVVNIDGGIKFISESELNGNIIEQCLVGIGSGLFIIDDYGEHTLAFIDTDKDSYLYAVLMNSSGQFKIINNDGEDLTDIDYWLIDTYSLASFVTFDTTILDCGNSSS